MSEFFLGARVQIKPTFHSDMLPKDSIGTVCDLSFSTNSSNSIGVCWDHKHDYFHLCHGKCPDGHGYYVAGSLLELLQVDVGDLEDDL